MKRLPASTWKKHVANYAKSDMTVKDYCRKHKIQPKTLYYWKKKLGDPMRKGASQSDLVAVQLGRGSSAGELTVRLRNGVEITVSDSIDPERLSHLINTLEA